MFVIDGDVSHGHVVALDVSNVNVKIGKANSFGNLEFFRNKNRSVFEYLVEFVEVSAGR